MVAVVNHVDGGSQNDDLKRDDLAWGQIVEKQTWTAFASGGRHRLVSFLLDSYPLLVFFLFLPVSLPSS